MTLKQYYRMNRKLFRKEKRPLVPYIFLGLGIVLLLLSWQTGIGLKNELLKEYCEGPMAGVILAEPKDATAVNDAVVSRAGAVKGIRCATGIYEFPAVISYGTRTVNAEVWAVDWKQISDIGLRYISVSEGSMAAQLPMIITANTAEQLGDDVTAGDRVNISIQGSEQVAVEIAAVTDIADAGTQISDVFKDKVITGLEDAEALMRILFEHKVWPGQDTAISDADHERMKYRYVIAFADDPKKTQKASDALEEAGFRCITGLGEIQEKTDKSRPISLGFLLSGTSFTLCALYMIRSVKRQRLEMNRQRTQMLRDLGWAKSETNRLLLMDINVTVMISVVCAVVIRTIVGHIF